MIAADLKDYVNGSDEHLTYIESCVDQAIALVDGYVGNATVPELVLERAYLEVGSELFHRRNAPNGVAQFNTFDGSAIRVARDPMVGAYPLLRRFVGFGAA